MQITHQTRNIAFKCNDIANNPKFAPLKKHLNAHPEMKLQTIRTPFENSRTFAEIKGIDVIKYNGKSCYTTLSGWGKDEEAAISDLWKDYAGASISYNYYEGGSRFEKQTTFPKYPQQINNK